MLFWDKIISKFRGQNLPLQVRVAKEQDKEGIKKFYEENPSPFIIHRPECEINAAITRGHYFIIEKLHCREIVAISAIFNYDENKTDLVELSDTLVTELYRGLGIQGFLLRMRITYLIATQGDQVRISTAINAQNKSSLKNQERLGFEPWVPDHIVYNSCSSCANKSSHRPCCCDYFLLPQKAKIDAVKEALLNSDSEYFIFKNEKRQEKVRFDLRFLESEIRDDLKEFILQQSPSP